MSVPDSSGELVMRVNTEEMQALRGAVIGRLLAPSPHGIAGELPFAGEEHRRAFLKQYEALEPGKTRRITMGEGDLSMLEEDLYVHVCTAPELPTDSQDGDLAFQILRAIGRRRVRSDQDLATIESLAPPEKIAPFGKEIAVPTAKQLKYKYQESTADKASFPASEYFSADTESWLKGSVRKLTSWARRAQMLGRAVTGRGIDSPEARAEREMSVEALEEMYRYETPDVVYGKPALPAQSALEMNSAIEVRRLQEMFGPPTHDNNPNS